MLQAHLIRNQLAYWSLIAIAMGAESQRVIPATGTPFNNQMQDMATLEAYIIIISPLEAYIIINPLAGNEQV